MARRGTRVALLAACAALCEGTLLANLPVKIHQGVWCLDQNWGADVDDLVLFLCKPFDDANQEFIWEGHPVMGYNHLVGSLDGRCVGIHPNDTDASGKPNEGSMLQFFKCESDSKLIRWTYSYGQEQVKLTHWLDLCMDFSEMERKMLIWTCKFRNSIFGDPIYNQVFRFDTKSEYTRIPENVPLELSQDGWCVDQEWSVHPAQLILYNCNQLNNQEWIWRGHVSWGYHHLVSGLDGLCVGVNDTDADGKPLPGASLVLKPCTTEDLYIRWRRVHGMEWLQMAEFPDICMDYDESWSSMLSVRRFQVYPCLYPSRWNQQINYRLFNEKNRDFLPIEENLPLKIKLGFFCLDHHWGAEVDDLILFACTGVVNQEFIWGGHAMWGFHHLYSNLNSQCLSVDQNDTDATGRPDLGATIVFRKCEYEDRLQRWQYSYGQHQLKMDGWPDLCMDFSEDDDHFIVWTCKYEDDMIIGWSEVYNQKFEIQMRSEYEEVPREVPLEIRQGSTGAYCLDHDYSAEKDDLVLFMCKKSNNQMFIWHGHPMWHWKQLVSALNGLCIGIHESNTDEDGVPILGTPVEFLNCTGPLVRWRYVHGMHFIAMSEFGDRCLDFDDNQDKFIVWNCKWNLNGNQQFYINDLGYKPIPENKPIQIEQGLFCLDQKWADDPDTLILFMCKGSNNQLFLWHGHASWYYHFIVSDLNSFCVGVSSDDTEESGKPKLGAVIGFYQCDWENDLLKWVYSYGQEQLKMAAWLDMCLDYSEDDDRFIVWTCKFDDANILTGRETYNQRFRLKALEEDEEERENAEKRDEKFALPDALWRPSSPVGTPLMVAAASCTAMLAVLGAAVVAWRAHRVGHGRIMVSPSDAESRLSVGPAE